nr:hypothetical protein [Tanacetum cinerariifolium]
GSNAIDVPSSSSLVNDRLSGSSSGTVRFKNDQVAKIMEYDDYQQGNGSNAIDVTSSSSLVNDRLSGSSSGTVRFENDQVAKIMEYDDYHHLVRESRKKVVVSSDTKGSSSDDFSKLKKITALLAKAFNRIKFYSKPTNNNLRTSSSSQSANKKQEFVKTGDKKEDKKADEKKRDMSRVKCYNCKKEGHFAKYCKKAKVKDYKYYKKKMLLAKKDKDEQVLLAEDQAWMESS